MREGLEYKKIGSFCSIKTGKLDANASSADGKYPFFTCSKETLRIDHFAYDCECVLVTGNGDLNVKYYNGKFNAYQRTYIITLMEGVDNVSMRYIFCFFSKYVEELRLKSIGGVIKYIKLGDLTNASILIPSLSEQEQIVAELDLLSGIIEKKKAQLKEYDKLAQSIFYDMFGDPVTNEKGWEVKKLEELCEKIVDCPHSTPKKVEYITQYPCIRTSELRGGSVQWETMQYLDESEYIKRIARLKPISGDIVFGREGTIGDAVILPNGFNFCLGQRTMLLRVNQSIVSNVFFHRVILSEWVKRQIDAVNVSSTVAHVNIKDFKTFKVPLPPLSLQQSFAGKIEAIEHQKELIKQSLKETETLFNSRMAYYFN